MHPAPTASQTSRPIDSQRIAGVHSIEPVLFYATSYQRRSPLVPRSTGSFRLISGVGKGGQRAWRLYVNWRSVQTPGYPVFPYTVARMQ